MAGAFTLTHFNGNSVIRIPRRQSPHIYSPVMVAMTKQTYWSSVDADVEAHLKQAIAIKPPITVFEPMHHLTFSAPRSAAPALCIAACELIGGTRHQAVAAAAAIHLMHAATYAHEHVTLTGPAPISKPKTNFDPNIELMTGDGLIPYGFELLAKSEPENPDRILRVLIEIARATGSQGMINGRHNENEISRSGHDWVEHVCKKKDGVLHACGAACGAILGGGTEDEVERLRRFGLYVGMIKGIISKINGGGGGDKVLIEKMDELRSLAMDELKVFDNGRIETILSLVDTN